MSCSSCCNNNYMGLKPNNNPLPIPAYNPPRRVPTHHVEDGRIVRRGGFADQQKRRLAAVARNPRRITFRELMGLLFVAWALWRLVPLVSEGYQLITMNADSVCRKASYFWCMRVHSRIVWWKTQEWIGQWIVWLPVVVVVTFAAEAVGIDRLF
ncbi:hypothetical protein GQ53DRAFT_740292 [Thozetella sp. PMI_491]|nr:hypothetical protein GQ53DRAFT_740292 [Thozetella sp. PMI_491]